jgi:Bax protein
MLLLHCNNSEVYRMRKGSIGSRIFRSLCLAALVGAVSGLGVIGAKGLRAPSLMPSRMEAEAAETAHLRAEDVNNAARLDRALNRMGYRLDAVGDGLAEVPPLFLAQVPPDLDEIDDTDTRKALFVKVMLPLVLAVDEEIAADRARLQDIAQRAANHQYVSAAEQDWTADLARRYDLDEPSYKRLLARVDVVPPSLALAQSAEESGWGTSNLVRRSQNLFGHTVDLGGDETAMRNFTTLYEAVRAYVHNLNTHKAYEGLRQARALARHRGQAPDGQALAVALSSYSERGTAYVDTIRSLIRRNDLNRFDHARLGRVPMARQVASAS